MNSVIYSLKQLFPEHLHDLVFLVGGTVRDHKLGIKGKDIDLAAALSDSEFSDSGFHLVAGISTMPIWFRHDPAIGTIEAVQLDSKTALQHDLLRRDFTANAMAISLSGIEFDPLCGCRDLDNKILRICSAETFKDDPLRIFRAFRFLADSWCMAAETETLIRDYDWNHLLEKIPVERFSREMIKALGGVSPELFFKTMLDLEIGAVFLPELFKMPKIPAGPLKYHPEGDLYAHSIQVLQKVSSQTTDPMIRFCAFFHDIGKLATIATVYPKHHGHDMAGFNLAITLCDRLRLPGSYKSSLAWVSRLHTTFNLWDKLRDSTKLRLAEQAHNASIQVVLPLICSADKSGCFNMDEWMKVLHISGMTTSELGIESHILLKIKDFKRKDYILQKRVESLQTAR